MTLRIERAAIARIALQVTLLDDPSGAEEWLGLLKTLYAVGRRDLPLGRLFEGHVDAVQIVSRYGSAAQRAAAQAAARTGAVFGVWNAELTGEPAILTHGRLSGGKAFASGAGLLTHALITAEIQDRRQLVLVDLAATPPAIDRSWWNVTGMQRSETHRVRWDKVPLGPDALVGAPGDYEREPWFSGGALRFVAVQAGGIAAVVDKVRDHLVTHDRQYGPHQAGRLADLFVAAQAAADAVLRASAAWSTDDVPLTVAQVAAARVAVYRAGEQVLSIAQAAIGVPAMFVDHSLSEVLGDLSVYLRQPGPDAQRMRVGAAVADNLLSPHL